MITYLNIRFHRVKLVYEGYRVKVKVTRRNHEVCVYIVYGCDGSNSVTAMFVTLPEITTRTKCTHSWMVGLRFEGNLVLNIFVLNNRNSCCRNFYTFMRKFE